MLIPRQVQEFLLENQPWDASLNWSGLWAWVQSPAALLWFFSAFLFVLAVAPRFPDMTGRQALLTWRLPILAGCTVAIWYRIAHAAPQTSDALLTDPSFWFLVAPILMMAITALAVKVISRVKDYSEDRIWEDDRRWVYRAVTGSDDNPRALSWCWSEAPHSCSSGWAPIGLLRTAQSRPLSVRFWGTDFAGKRKRVRRPESVYLGRRSCPAAAPEPPPQVPLTARDEYRRRAVELVARRAKPVLDNDQGPAASA